MDQIRALEVFIAVADSHSFAAAARELSVSPPSVTRIINDLEETLGAVLLRRTTRLVSLTDVGHIYLEDAKRIVQDLESANDLARGAHREPKGHLRVTAPMLFGQIYILPIILDFLDQFESVTAEGIYLDRVVNLFEEGIDVAVRIGELQDSSLVAKHVGNVKSTVCGSPQYFEKYGIPKTPEDLCHHRLIGLALTNPKPEWRFKDDKKLQFKPRLTFSVVPAGIAAAKLGWGLTRVFSYQIASDLEDGSLLETLEEYAPEPIPIHIVYAEGRRASAKVRSFVDLAVERLRNNPYIN